VISSSSLANINKRFNAMMPFVTPLGVVIGFLLGSRLEPFRFLGPYIFACITFVGALGVSISQFAKIGTRLKSVAVVLFCAHIILPILVTLLARLIFPNQPEIVTGFILLTSIPIAVTSFIWATIYEGDAALALSLIILDTLLSPILTPTTIKILADTAVSIDQRGIMISLLGMIVLPSLLGMLVTQVAPEASKKAVLYLSPITKILLIVIVLITVGVLGDTLTFSLVYVPLIIANLVVIAMGFFLVYAIARYALKVDKASLVSMTFTGGMRNISAALVLATTYFSPLAALPTILGIILQQTTVAVIGSLLFAKKKVNKEQ